MTSFSRREIAQILELDETFLMSLEHERILVRDAPDPETGEYSVRMLERARVAHSLVHELEINLAGAAVVLRLREELGDLRAQLRTLAAVLRERGIEL